MVESVCLNAGKQPGQFTEAGGVAGDGMQVLMLGERRSARAVRTDHGIDRNALLQQLIAQRRAYRAGRSGDDGGADWSVVHGNTSLKIHDLQFIIISIHHIQMFCKDSGSF